MMKYQGRFFPTIGIIVLMGIAGSLMIHYGTYWGPWAYSDSSGYLASAQNLLDGHGLGYFAPSGNFKPLTIHPPLYPLVLSAMGVMGFEMIEAARWLNIILFGLTISLSGLFTYSLFHSSWFSLSLSATLLTMPSLVDVSSGAMSELLFFFTTILGICSMAGYLAAGKKYLLILSAVSVGLAFLSRFNGVVLVGIGMIVLLVASRYAWRRRIGDTLVFSLVSIAPAAIWLIRTYLLTKTLAARNYNLPSDIWSGTVVLRREFIEIFKSWLPYQKLLPAYSYNLYRNLFIILSGLILISFLLVVFRRFLFRKSSPGFTREFSFALIWIIFIIGNALFLAASYLFTNLLPNLESRTFMPIQIGLVFALLALVLSISNEFRIPRSFGWVCVLMVLVLDLSYAGTSWNIISQYHTNGAGYTSKVWHNSTTLKTVRSLSASIPIITNESAALLLLLGRPAFDFCTSPCNQSGEIRYGDDPQDPVQQVFRQDGAALALFYPYCGVQDQAWYSETIAQFTSLTRDLTHYFSSCDGDIYFYPASGQ